MIGTLTVQEHLEYIAMLKLPEKISYNERMKKVIII